MATMSPPGAGPAVAIESDFEGIDHSLALSLAIN